jgi:glycosyltransferase involved in cell wall biosynthesis
VRITLIVPGFSADEDDWCIPALRSLAAELARRNDVRVLALHYPYQTGSYVIDGASVRALGGANVRGARRAALLLRAVAWTVAEHRRRPTDVLHGMWADEAGAVAVSAAQLLRVPVVVSLSGGELVELREIGYGGRLSRLGRRLLPPVLRHATRVTVGSSTLECLAAPQVAAERLARLPLGVNTERFSPRWDSLPQAAGFRLLSVASLTPVKDHATLLRALATVVRVVPSAHLDLVGEGPLRRELRAHAEGLGIAEHVTFHGAVPHDRLPEHYRAANLFVVSSRYESQGMAALEAAACGCPIVGTAVGVLPDLPGVRVVAVSDDAALADAVIAVLSAREDLAARARATYEVVSTEFSVSRAVDRFCSLYEEVLAA